MPVVNVNGESLHYIKTGEGPVIAFVQFLGGHTYQWRHQIAALRDRFTCIAIDTRGFGFSSYNDHWDVPTGAQDLHDALEALGVEDAHIVGYSMGGPVAMTFNANWPDMVRSLVLIDTFAKNHTHSEARIAESELCFRYMSLREYARQYAATRLMPTTSPDAFDELVTAICHASKDVYRDVLKGILIPDFTPLTAKVKVPTLVMCGQHDRTTPVEFSRNLASLIDGAVERIIEAGHLGALDDPKGFNVPLVEFLDAQPR